MPRSLPFSVCAPPEEALDDAVLQRMKGDDRKPPAGLQHALGGGEALHQLAQLVVDVDPQRLEDTRRRMPAGDLLPPQNPFRQFSQLGCARERLIAAAGDDGPGDGARAALVAQMEEDVGEIRIVFRVDDVGGGRSAFPMRMSSGPSLWNEKPRSGSSSCMEETPMSSTTPSAGAKPRHLRCGPARRMCLRPASSGPRPRRQVFAPRQWQPDRGRWRERALRARRPGWRRCSRRRRTCRQ